MGGTEFSPQRKKKNAEKRVREEKRWASKSGEVKVSQVQPEPIEDIDEQN